MGSRIRVILLLFIIGSLLMPVFGLAENAQLRLETDRQEAFGGDLILLKLYLTVEGMGGLQAEIQWDTSGLEYVPDTAAFTEPFSDNGFYKAINDDGNGLIALTYANTNGYSAKNEAILTATFKAKDAVNGSCHIYLKNVKMTDSTAQLAAINCETQNAAIQIAVYDPGRVETSLIADDLSVKVGDTLTVTMLATATGGTIGSFQGELKYDPEILTLVDSSPAFSKAWEAAKVIGMFSQNKQGSLRFVYASTNGCNSPEVFSVQFQVLKGSESGSYLSLNNVKFSNQETEHLSEMPCTIDNLWLYPSLQPDTQYFELHAIEDEAGYGDTITLAIALNGTMLGGFQGKLLYDPSLLEYVSGSACFSNSLSSGAMLTMINDSTIGIIEMLYSNTKGYEPNGTNIFSAEFKIKKCGADIASTTALESFKVSTTDANAMDVNMSSTLTSLKILNHNEIVDPAVESTCTTEGLSEGKHCSICGEVLRRQEHIVPLGHEWGTPKYEWSADNSKVTATRICAHDAEHIETETVNVTSEVTKPATCEAKGETTYTATFTNAAFAVQTKTVDDVDALNHAWGTPTYKWSVDNSQVTATRVCAHDAEHVETETVTAASEITKAATCEAKGETTYTAAFENTAFAAQTKTVEDVEALGHEWGEPIYEWSDDNRTIHAIRICRHDENHIDEETVKTEISVVTSPTEDNMGETAYTSPEFENEAFKLQMKKAKDIPALKDLTVMKLPTMLKEIGAESFANLACEAVIIPDGCTRIGSKAFAECKNLIYVRIPDSVKEIAVDSFEGCDQVRLDRK